MCGKYACKYEATASRQLVYLGLKSGNREKASLALSEGNKILLLAALKNTNYQACLFNPYTNLSVQTTSCCLHGFMCRTISWLTTVVTVRLPGNEQRLPPGLETGC